MQRQAILQRLKRDQHGAAALEFALVAGAMFMLMFAVIEYGLIMMTKIAIESATVQVSRSEGIGSIVAGCSDRVCSVKKLVQQKTFGLVKPQAVVVNATVVSSNTTASPPIPDVCLDNINDPYPKTCKKWQENSGSAAAYDPPAAMDASSIGQGGDLVEIRVSYLWHVMFPIFRSYFGKNGVLTISSATVVMNEPFPSK